MLAPEITGYVVSKVQQFLSGNAKQPSTKIYQAPVQLMISWLHNYSFGNIVLISSLVILVVSLLRGLLMFFMRQTLIVMSRHIEYDLKNEVYAHYQQLDAGFFKQHSTGDMMNRIAEDVSRVRMYAGPALMYSINLVALIGFSLVNMLRKDVQLSLIVLSPLPLLAVTIYIVNTIIHKKSEVVQAALSDLTSNAQESYSGIRIIKSFVQEKAMLGFFTDNSNRYRKNAVSLAKVESVYFPAMSLLIGLSTLITIFIGGKLALADPGKAGLIVEFVIYINMLTFPVSSIGWVASMVQRASASQKRINEFLQTETKIKEPVQPQLSVHQLQPAVSFRHVSFTYPDTGIKALNNFSLDIQPYEKIMILGKTGSGKSTLAQLLLRFYDADKGSLTVGGTDIRNIPLHRLRQQISYVPQDTFLFSDSVFNNISFGFTDTENHDELVPKYARHAAIHEELLTLEKGYGTVVGERGVTLSGGQKQRVSIARALMKEGDIVLLDDSLSAVDAKTEYRIVNNLSQFLQHKTTIIITHRIFTSISFDKIIVMDEGSITEQGTHTELLSRNSYYRHLFNLQLQEEITT